MQMRDRRTKKTELAIAEERNMAEISRLIILIGVVGFLGACSDEQIAPAQSHAITSPNPAIVRKVQIALRNRGYYAGVVDGFLGQRYRDRNTEISTRS